ncbi:hypothetical protein [Chlamydia felis Fe/C-56]|uniref:Uncharacterized protein n=1 Tax=Chlamydia felis (strain Fe/C-56) TaxID=264202 RepID=Q254D8_CHLFF|nr:hypothetical protein [Chlamydia felis Fe/C-56]
MKFTIIPRLKHSPPTALSSKNQIFVVSIKAEQLPTTAKTASIMRTTEVMRINLVEGVNLHTPLCSGVIFRVFSEVGATIIGNL